jgi:hypothetical protein
VAQGGSDSGPRRQPEALESRGKAASGGPRGGGSPRHRLLKGADGGGPRRRLEAAAVALGGGTGPRRRSGEDGVSGPSDVGSRARMA